MIVHQAKWRCCLHSKMTDQTLCEPMSCFMSDERLHSGMCSVGTHLDSLKAYPQFTSQTKKGDDNKSVCGHREWDLRHPLTADTFNRFSNNIC